MFVSLASNAKLEIIETKIENVSEAKHDKGKYILGVPPKVVKETKQNNHCSTNKKSQPKKPHFCHHYEASGHTHPNCYKWLATQQSNSVLSFGGQNQLQNSFAPIGEFLKAMMFLTNFNWFNPPYSSHQRSQNRKDSSPSKSPFWMEKDSFKWFHIYSCISCVFGWLYLSQSSLYCPFNMFGCVFVCFWLSIKK